MVAGEPFVDTANIIQKTKGKYAWVPTSSNQFAFAKLGPQQVYLAYVLDGYFDAPELVGVFASKAGAYKAARRRFWERLFEYWDVYNDDSRWRNDYRLRWLVVPTDVAP